jgi:putative transposase
MPIIHRAYRFRLEPTNEQAALLTQHAGACRWVWNYALGIVNRARAAGQQKPRYLYMAHMLTAWRAALPWLSSAPVHALQQRLRDLDAAIQASFGEAATRKGWPRLKKKGSDDTIRHPDAFSFVSQRTGHGRLKLPKVGWVRCRAHRDVVGTLRSVTVRREGQHWFASLLAEQERPGPAPHEGPPVGVDLGVAHFATLSTGEHVDLPKTLGGDGAIARQILRAQRTLSRRVKQSANWHKARARLAALHSRVARIRQDFHHKASLALAKNHGVVCMEDLSVRSMSASSAGTAEKPGRKVRQKAGLNRSILRQGWYAFRVMLGYKLAERGGRLVLVDPKNTSRACNRCGGIDAASRRSQSRFECVACGHRENADVNAARNILARGFGPAVSLMVAACGGMAQQGQPLKQEPALPVPATPTPQRLALSKGTGTLAHGSSPCVAGERNLFDLPLWGTP